MVAGRARSTGRPGPTPPRCGRRPAAPTRVVSTSAAAVLGEVRKAKTEARSGRCAPRSSRAVVTRTAEQLAALEAARATSATPG